MLLPIAKEIDLPFPRFKKQPPFTDYRFLQDAAVTLERRFRNDIRIDTTLGSKRLKSLRLEANIT